MLQRTHEQFIDLLNKKYPDRDWEVLGIYEHNTIPILIKDKYGECLIQPNRLFQRSAPSIKTAVNKTSYIINKFKDVWGEGEFDYSKFEYNGVREKSTLICKKGHEFLSDANNHLSKRGCPQCAKESVSGRVRSNTEEFIVKAMDRLGTERNIYREFEYVTAKTKSKIWCPTHNDFYMITPNDHLTGYSCGFCNTGGYNGRQGYKKLVGDKKSKVYIILCENAEEKFYKIGITCNNLSVRYSRYKYGKYFEHTEVLTVEFDAGVAWDTEKELLYKYKHFKYTPKEKFDGCTECFTLDLPIKEIKSKLSQK